MLDTAAIAHTDNRGCDINITEQLRSWLRNQISSNEIYFLLHYHDHEVFVRGTTPYQASLLVDAYLTEIDESETAFNLTLKLRAGDYAHGKEIERLADKVEWAAIIPPQVREGTKISVAPLGRLAMARKGRYEFPSELAYTVIAVPVEPDIESLGDLAREAVHEDREREANASGGIERLSDLARTWLN